MPGLDGALAGGLGELAPGIDVCEVSQVADSLERFGEQYLRRVFHPDEVARALAAPETSRAKLLAGWFAAKEAAVKTLQPGAEVAIGWPQLCVDEQAGTVTLHGNAAAWARGRGVGHLHVSITREGGRAMAVALAVAPGQPGTGQNQPQHSFQPRPYGQQGTISSDDEER